MYLVGLMHLEGRKVEQSDRKVQSRVKLPPQKQGESVLTFGQLRKAFIWLRRAALAGHVDAAVAVGVLCSQGRGVTARSELRALHYMLFAADRGSPDGLLGAAKLLLLRHQREREGVGKEEARGLQGPGRGSWEESGVERGKELVMEEEEEQGEGEGGEEGEEEDEDEEDEEDEEGSAGMEEEGGLGWGRRGGRRGRRRLSDRAQALVFLKRATAKGARDAFFLLARTLCDGDGSAREQRRGQALLLEVSRSLARMARTNSDKNKHTRTRSRARL